ncbi:Antitoxin HigA [Pontiella desulfatans]|uniref:Antitoxin HigA n=1 Tax=Pontiella desulfatans TaxID=2750659 RepID=A0A6C2U706_PONDE|nr:DNA-binding protein [Pontiella desulfatans]VGO15204.1 Antitoxin HigA [Pontiella desulfatans]
MKPKVIKTEEEYDEAQSRIEVLMGMEKTPEVVAELELFATLVEVSEDRVYPMPAPDPIAAIRFRMEQQALKQKDLIPYVGSKSKVSEVLSGKRSLSISMIRKIHEGLGIPVEVLLGQGSEPEALVA